MNPIVRRSKRQCIDIADEEEESHIMKIFPDNALSSRDVATELAKCSPYLQSSKQRESTTSRKIWIFRLGR
jgi:hypothetical protein